MKYLIQDWASNYLQYTKKFNFSAYGNNKGVPMEFDCFDDAVEFLDLNYSDEERENLYIVEVQSS